MIDQLGGVTEHAVRLALDIAVLRHHVIANNIANVGTPDYAPARLSFERYLRAAETGFWDVSDDRALEARLVEAETRIAAGGVTQRSAEGPVKLDEEVVRLADNTIRYQALLEGIARQMSILRVAIDQGRS